MLEKALLIAMLSTQSMDLTLTLRGMGTPGCYEQPLIGGPIRSRVTVLALEGSSLPSLAWTWPKVYKLNKKIAIPLAVGVTAMGIYGIRGNLKSGCIRRR